MEYQGNERLLLTGEKSSASMIIKISIERGHYGIRNGTDRSWNLSDGKYRRGRRPL
jgi:hypothetical protein